MKRKDFLQKGLPGVLSIIGIGAIVCNTNDSSSETKDCIPSPRETRGPFPNKTPAQLMHSNIRSDRKGVALLINLVIQDKSNDCKPLAGAIVDIWHCDKDGYYSQYGDHPMQREDLRAEDFLRGRQVADDQGRVSFLSIYPGWYSGRAPHIHLEILDSHARSLLVTQIAFPGQISEIVYASPLYKDRGLADTNNESDGIFRGDLEEEMGIVSGNLKDGFTLMKEIIVKT